VPITRIFWTSLANSSRDIHVLRGQSTRDLRTGDLAFDIPGPPATSDFAANYLSTHTDVSLAFIPLFNGALAAPMFVGTGNGISVDTRTGAVTVAAGAPARRKNNFIIEVAARNLGNPQPLTEVIRVQVHNAVTNVWLSPDRLSVRPTGAPRPAVTGYRFSVRAQFDDGVIGDLTDGHGVIWSANVGGTPHPIAANGKIVIAAGDNPGDNIVVRATLPAALGGGFADAQLHIDRPWATEPTPPTVGVVVGGGWPGAISPEQVPNILMLGDGFTAADRAAFDRIVNTFVHHLKNTKFVRPFDILATSINFWKTFVPALQRGISVRSEVFTFKVDGKQFARPLPLAEKPPATGDWKIEHVMYAVGLPVPGDEAKSNAALKAEWAQLLNPDPSPNIGDDLIGSWKTCASRALIEERDGFPALSYGALPAANEKENISLSLHDERGGDDALRSLGAVLASDSGVTLTGGAAVGQLWTTFAPPSRFDNTGLILIISSFPGGRATNAVGFHMHLSTEAGNVDIPVKPAAPGLNALLLDLASVPTSVSADRCRTVAHELGHSFGLGDEYVDFNLPFPRTEADLQNFSNLQTDADARVGGALNSAQIKWNWQRIRKAAVVSGPITPVGSQFLIPVTMGGLQFTTKDRMLLRLRPPGALRKASLVAADTLTSTQELELAAPPASNLVTVRAASGSTVTLADLTRFVAGSILFVPTLAPHDAFGVKYATMVAKNIGDFINTNRPLTVVPCVFDDENPQKPIIPGVSLPGLCFKHKPRIVGLYSGGDRFACGIFHPSGTCMMRTHHDDDSEFCAVCRYIAVDMIDPYHHQEIDLDFDDIYPLR
jgi:hypothetical protein